MKDRMPGAPGRCKAVVTAEELQKMQSGNEFAITLRRDDQPIQEGTPYSKAAVLPDAVAAKLCPGIQDPTPGDAFGALYTQKADTVRHASGSNITLHNAAHTPFMGLNIYGGFNGEELVGESGSVTVNVSGKNILNVLERNIAEYSSAVVLEKTDDYVIVKCDAGDGSTSWGSGWFYYNEKSKISFKKGVTYTISAYYTFLDDPKRPASITYITQFPRPLVSSSSLVEDTSKQSWHRPAVGVRSRIRSVWTATKDVYDYFCIPIMSGTVKIENVMIEIGDTVTAYEPYSGMQTLTVPTPFALDSVDDGMGGSVEDEIDFAKGVYIRRTEDGFVMDAPEETPLPDDVLEAYAKLHTYAPTTVISNNYGEKMKVVYYTDTTAVQMVHSPADQGKTFTIDAHGCVTLIKDNPEIAFGETTIDGVKWRYRKWNNGFAELWSSVVPLGYEGSRILSRWTALPFPVLEKATSIIIPGAELSYLLQESYILSYLDIDGGSIMKICAIRDAGGFTEEDNINVSVYITGLWKVD